MVRLNGYWLNKFTMPLKPQELRNATFHSAFAKLAESLADEEYWAVNRIVTPASIGRRELWWSLALLAGSFSWALGSVLSKKWRSTDPFSATAWQVTFAGIANFIFAVLFERISDVTWTARGIGAILYLVVCGSWIGYTAYIWLLQHVPTSKVATYAYVNPVVAVFLGWLVLHERIDHFIVLGTAVVVASVVLVTSAKIKTRTVADELPPVEAAGD